MKITSIDRQTCKTIREKLNAALTDVAEELGLSIKLSSGRYSSNNTTFKVEASVINSDGVVENQLAQDFKFYAAQHGLSPDDLGKEFKDWKGRTYKILGIKPRSYKFPIIGEDVNGKRFKFASYTVRSNLTS